MSRWILGNLDCETWWAQQAGERAGRTVRSLPQHVMGRIALYATLLRVFAEEGDTIWTPGPIDPRCVRPVDGLPKVRWADGALPPCALESEPLAWGRAAPLPLDDDEVGVMLTVADKCAQWGDVHDMRLPGSRILTAIEGLDRDRPASWIAKAPYSAAGRGRVRGSGARLRVEAGRGVQRLLEDHGAVLLEPWLPRTQDLGFWRASTAAGSDGGRHELAVDGSGRFQGITTPPETTESPDRVPDGTHGAQAADAVRTAAAWLSAHGYNGPFGVDAFRYTDGDDGASRLHAPCEINPRLTFGRVAHAYLKRLRPEADGVTLSLRFGHEPERPSESVIPLLGSATDPIMYAWLVLDVA